MKIRQISEARRDKREHKDGRVRSLKLFLSLLFGPVFVMSGRKDNRMLTVVLLSFHSFVFLSRNNEKKKNWRKQPA